MARSAAALLGCALGLLASVLIGLGVSAMASTAIYSVYNPASDTIYYAPLGFEIVPNANSVVTVEVTLYDSNGNLLNEASMAAIVHDVTTNTDVATNTNTNGSDQNCSAGAAPYGPWVANGSDVVTVGGSWHFQVPYLNVARMDMHIISYVGSVYSPPPSTLTNIKTRRAGAWSTPTAIKVRRSGAWVNATAVYVRRNGAWVKVWG